MLSLPQAPAPVGVAVRLHGISHTFTVEGVPRPAVSGISLDIAPGSFVSLLGPSGCGKSTLLRIAGGLLRPRAGTVEIDGDRPRAAQKRGAIGFLSQDAALLPWRTVAANIRLPREILGRSAGKRQQDPPAIDALLDLVGLAGFGRYYPHQLSGGMKQRVALARALAGAPSLLLMDEPFGALDDMTRTEMRHELARIVARINATVLFVTHSVAEAVLLSDRIAVISSRPGRVRVEMPVDLPRPRPPDETDPAIAPYIRRLRALLREE